MDGQRARLAARRFDRATTIPPAAAPSPAHRHRGGARTRAGRHTARTPDARTSSPTRWAGAIGIGWPLAIIVSMASGAGAGRPRRPRPRCWSSSPPSGSSSLSWGPRSPPGSATAPPRWVAS